MAARFRPRRVELLRLLQPVTETRLRRETRCQICRYACGRHRLVGHSMTTPDALQWSRSSTPLHTGGSKRPPVDGVEPGLSRAGNRPAPLDAEPRVWVAQWTRSPVRRANPMRRNRLETVCPATV